MKLLKPLLTTFLAFYLSICPIKAQEQKPKHILVNKRKYSLLEDKVTTEHNIIVKDKKTLLKVLKTLQIQQEIDSLQLSSATLKALELYAKGQELTIKYSDHIDWALRLPAKILAKITTGQPINLEDLTIKKLKQSAKDIANDPEKQLKHLAYEYFSKANEKAKFNLTILRKKPQLDYKTAKQFEENSYFIDTYIKPSQQLYYDIENLRKLEERWAQTFLQEINKTLPKGTDKITDLLLQKYEDIIKERLKQLKPYEKFQKSITENKQKHRKTKLEKQKSLEKRTEALIKKINFDDNIIVYVSNLTGNFEIYSMTKEGKNKIQLTNNGYRNLFPKWTPKEKIIFCSNPKKGKSDLYLMDKTGTFIQQLTKTSESEGDSIMLSNGDIIFILTKNGNNNIYLKEALGKTKQLTNTKGDECDLNVSHDEKWICFERDIKNVRNGKREGVFILNLENGLERQLDCHGHNPRFILEGKIGYIKGRTLIIKDIYGTKHKEIEEKQLDPKEPNTKTQITYLLGDINKNTIMYRFDVISLPEKKFPTVKNIYTYNLKTKELKKLTNNGIGVWNDHANCLKK